MRVGVTGGSGLIGRPLVTSLRTDGHEVVRFVRGPVTAGDERSWDPAARRMDPLSVADLDAVVHLAGAGVADKRWNEARKKVILDSRMDGTSTVAAAMAAATGAASGPRILLSASGISVYGDTGDRVTDETASSGTGFLAEVCRQWEAATAPAEAAGIRVAHLRTGIVLSSKGGALAKQLPIFRLGMGAPLAGGRQWNSWISLRDEVAAITHCLTADIHGPVNLVSPAPVTNREFTRVLGKVLKRPTLAIPVPAAALRLALGPVVDEVVLQGQRLRPGVLLESGFTFAHPELEPALREAVTDSAADA